MRQNDSTTQKPACRHTCRTWSPEPCAMLLTVVCLAGAGCSSGGTSGNSPIDNTATTNTNTSSEVSSDTTNVNANEPTNETGVETTTEENDIEAPVTTSDLPEQLQTTEEETPTIPATNNGESSPVELLVNEIRLASLDPVFQLNRKLQSGEPLTETESNCLGDFNPANGQVLHSIDCPIEAAGASVYSSDLQIYSATLDTTEACEQFLAAAANNSDQTTAATNTCNLDTSELLLPVVWIPLESSPPSQIGSVMPLQGAAISYNLDDSRRLLLQSVSDLFLPYSCEIDLTTMALTDEALAAGDCRQQVDRLIGRLFALRNGT